MTMRRNMVAVFAAAALALSAGCGNSESAAPADKPSAPAAPRTPLVQPKHAADWCGEHGVAESVCTRCNADLVPEFKKKGDWCDKHALPKSQCITCDPSLEAKLKALAPAGK